MLEEIRRHPMLMLVLLALTCSSGWGNYQYWVNQQHVSDLAHQGANTHHALCAFKHDLIQREANNEKFLTMTPDQRIARYGPALGAIPGKIIKQSIRGQQATLKSLVDLRDCAPPQ